MDLGRVNPGPLGTKVLVRDLFNCWNTHKSELPYLVRGRKPETSTHLTYANQYC